MGTGPAKRDCRDAAAIMAVPFDPAPPGVQQNTVDKWGDLGRLRYRLPLQVRVSRQRRPPSARVRPGESALRRPGHAQVTTWSRPGRAQVRSMTTPTP